MSYLLSLSYGHALDIVITGWERCERKQAELIYWSAQHNGFNEQYKTFNQFWLSLQQPQVSMPPEDILADVKDILDGLRG